LLLSPVAMLAQDAGAPADTSRSDASAVRRSDSAVSEHAQEIDPETLILNEGAPEEAAGTPQVISTWDFVRMLLILGGVVAVIYLIFRLMKRGARGRYQETELIRLLDYRSLSGNRALHLVEVGRSLYLVGCAENAVSLVSEIVDKESLDMIRLAVSERPEPEKKGFAEIFFGMFRADNGSGVSVKETLSFMKSQKDRLKKLQ
jgi:flagellar biogenesis protein FliO